MIAQSSYGKSRVRLVQVQRRPDRHDLRDLTIAIKFEGDYDASYTDGDNSAVLPTDTMKNTVYALAAREPVGEPESFALRLADHFLTRNARLTRVRIELTEHGWGRIPRGEREHGQAFVQTGSGARTASVESDRGTVTVTAGIADLVIMKSARFGLHGLPARRVHHAARDPRPSARDRADRVVAVRRQRSRVRPGVAGGPVDPARDVRGAPQRIGAAHAVRDGPGRAGCAWRRGGDPAGHAEPPPPPHRSDALRAAQPERGVRGDRGAARADRSDDCEKPRCQGTDSGSQSVFLLHPLATSATGTAAGR